MSSRTKTEPRQEHLHCIEFQLGDAAVVPLEDALAILGFTASSWAERDSGQAVVRIYAESLDQALEWQGAIKAGLSGMAALLGNDVPPARINTIRREDWSESWKEHFHAFRASDRLIVKPSWETTQTQPGDLVIELDPGMCFGTGYHGTTRACLHFMDHLAKDLGPVPFLDAGCGSGILSLAAVKLGFQPVCAVDHDPQAVEAARENLARQGIDTVRLITADLAAFVPPVPPRVVVANILAPVLLQHRERILSWFAGQPDNGRLVLSGILAEQYGEVHDAFAGIGAVETARRRMDEWTSACFVVPASKATGTCGDGSRAVPMP